MAEEDTMMQDMMAMMFVVMGIAIISQVLQVQAAPAEPGEPTDRTVTVALKNPPSGATKWQMRVVDWDVTQTISWGTTEQDNVGELATFDIPPGWSFPLRIGIQIYRKVNGSQQLYSVQSYRPYLWDFDKNDWGTEPDPDYREVFLSAFGHSYYDVSLEAFTAG